MQDIEFYQSHLDRVSRSFAFCIQKLPAPLRLWVSLSYLLCRVLDTIEDSPWNSKSLQSSQYQDFYRYLESLPSEADVAAWSKRFSDQIVDGEKVLLKETLSLFEDLHELPVAVRKAIQDGVKKMHQGMEYYSKRSGDGTLRLANLMDTNRYCYFVAGVVSDLLTRLFLLHRPDFRAPTEFRVNGLHFGLFLQKVNLLKDQLGDEKEGRYLVTDRDVLTGSLRNNAEGALDYLCSIPEDEKGYRTFCAWSLFLGAASLPFMAQAFQLKDGSKIPRSLTQELLTGIEEIVQDNGALKETFQTYLPYLPAVKEESPAIKDQAMESQWFLNLTRDTLKQAEIIQLGMFAE